MANLLAGEKEIRSGDVVWAGPPAVRPGHLTVTNQAIIFEGAGGGGGGMGGGGMGGGPFGGPRFRPGFGPRRMGMGGPGGGPRGPPGVLRIPLWRCRNATVNAGPQGSMLVVELLSRQLQFTTNDAPGWAAAINQARASAPPPPPGFDPRGGPGGGGPNRGAMPRCDYCGNLSSPAATKCESCGAPF